MSHDIVIESERYLQMEREYAERVDDLEYFYCVIAAIESAYGFFERFNFNTETLRFESDNVTNIELHRKHNNVKKLLDYPNLYPNSTREPNYVPDCYKERYDKWKYYKPFILFTLKEINEYYCHTVYVKVNDGIDYHYIDGVTDNKFKCTWNSFQWLRENFFPNYGKVVTIFPKEEK